MHVCCPLHGKVKGCPWCKRIEVVHRHTPTCLPVLFACVRLVSRSVGAIKLELNSWLKIGACHSYSVCGGAFGLHFLPCLLRQSCWQHVSAAKCLRAAVAGRVCMALLAELTQQPLNTLQLLHPLCLGLIGIPGGHLLFAVVPVSCGLGRQGQDLLPSVTRSPCKVHVHVYVCS